MTNLGSWQRASVHIKSRVFVRYGMLRVMGGRCLAKPKGQAVLGLKLQNVATEHCPHSGLRAWHT